MAAFSPHRDGGGTLHFPSPTHIHRADPSAALASLRRSLSRSPSKGPTFRLVTSKSISPSPGSPHTPSPLSPQGRRRSADLLSNSSVISPSPLATPFPPSARRSRSSARKLSPPRPITVASGTQRSPVKRGLSDSIHNGNATPPSPIGTGIGTENISPSGSPEDKVEAKTTLTGIGTSDDLLSPHHALVRFDRASGYFANSAAKSSPLKRSDGIMNLDMTSLDSPSAKRRSLHGASFSPDFDIFDHEAAMQSQANSDMPNDIEAPFSQPQTFYEHPSVLSKRTSSLRKTTLQQRYEKPFLGRLKPSTDLSHGLNTPGLPSSKSRPRMSLDNVFPQTTRDSPFSSQGSLPNASVHPISHQHREHQALVPPTIAQRHPLSRTITQSLAGSSAAEDSPTHIPHRHPDSRRPSVDFTKSLPLGAARPSTRAPVSREFTVQPSSTGTPFSTPESYKLAKPLPAAFMSTGLISKRNKDIHPEQLDMNASVASMPDTPCKRSSLNNVVPKPAPKNMVKPRHKHQSMHSFGTPSTPFNPHITRPSLGSFAKGVSIFGSGFGNRGLTRRASFLSTDGDEISASSLGVNIDSQSSTDMDVPPTPTRQAIVSTWAQQSAFGQNAFSPQVAANVEAPSFSGFESPRPERCSKSTSTHSPGVNAEEGSDGCLEDSPSTSLRFRSINAVSSFSKRPNLMKHARSPTLLSRSSLSVPLICTRNTKAKPSPLSPASPLFSEIEQNSPHTPQGNVHPPDPSGLSISVRGDGSDIECFTNVSYGSPLVLPATPTSTRDQISRFGKSRASMTPIHNPAPIELDTSLLSRFGKVEVIGTGEFSQVYRVTQKPESKLYQGFFTVSSVQEPSHTPLPNQVWAVKRSRQPFIGPKDRNRKLQEVEVLKALGRSDHTVELFGSWENKDHLYIQTEFCEEGSLDLFLDQVGRKARLDNFRIWKIMLELSLGLQHIHNCGFIHLDLKPANVLITFEGVLKIGDFGMATPWPAQPGIEGEGDREYIGPEILMGRYDKPADVFALGLIMLEIAGNVMLPDNGASWQRLRSGDMSDVPSLTSSSESSNILRDSSGKPLSREESFEDMYGADHRTDSLESPCAKGQLIDDRSKDEPKYQLLRCGELSTPPDFMVDPGNEEALDRIVRWMISPKPDDRPVVQQVLATKGVRWAQARRRAGATIYEGNWGPADEILQDDAEMIDV